MQRTDINIFILFRFYLDLIHRQENYHLFHLVNFNSLCNLPYLNDLWNSHNFNYGNYGTCKFYEKKKKNIISASYVAFSLTIMEIKTVIVINLSLHIHAHAISVHYETLIPRPKKSQYWFSDGTIKTISHLRAGNIREEF